MAKKRKISIRKILQALVTLVVMSACIVALQGASRIENEKTITDIDINILNGKQYRFLDNSKVMDILSDDRQTDLNKIPLGRMNIHHMESMLIANPWVETAQIHVDNNRVLHLFLNQRVPVVRVFETGGKSYYLDTNLAIMPLSEDYVHYTQVVTNVPVMKTDSAAKSLKYKIVSLVKYISGNTFWNTQISQIAIDSVYGFELIPILGNQRIILGDTNAMKDKFENLFIFYKKALNRIGWDKYEVLDLRYKGQVIASPALPWKGPVDKVMNRMNWANSITDTAVRRRIIVKRDTAKVDTIAKGPAASPVVVPKIELKKNAIEKKEIVKEKKKVIIPAAVHRKALKTKTAVAKPLNKHNPAAKKVVIKKAKEKKNTTPKYIYQKTKTVNH